MASAGYVPCSRTRLWTSSASTSFRAAPPHTQWRVHAITLTERPGASTPAFACGLAHLTNLACVRGHRTMRNLPSLALGTLRPAHESEYTMRAVAPQKRVARLVEPLSARAKLDKHIRCERAPVQCRPPQQHQQLSLSCRLCARVAAPRGRCRPTVPDMGMCHSCGPPPPPQNPSQPSRCRARAEWRRRRSRGTQCPW